MSEIACSSKEEQAIYFYKYEWIKIQFTAFVRFSISAT